MINTASSWIYTQQLQQRKIILVIDSCSETNPILEFFKNGITSLKNFICLYKDTELASNLENSPWLIELNDDFSINQISHLLENTEANWGWLASIDSCFTLEQLAAHWQQRMIIQEGSSKFIYRFQDNRTISWHLQNLSETDIPLLLGPINSVLAWDTTQWQSYSNKKPELCPTLSRAPWIDIPESDSVAKIIRYENMRNWLFNHFQQTIYQYSEIEDFHTWVSDELTLADKWSWDTREHWEFLLAQRLDPKQRKSEEWLPLENESPTKHYERCRIVFNKPISYIETYINTENL